MLSDPVTRAVAVTPSDTADLAEVTRYLYIGGAGTLKVDLYDGSQAVTVTFGGNIPTGFHPLRVGRVYSTGTSATSIVACY
jgi:hypothetical protein